MLLVDPSVSLLPDVINDHCQSKLHDIPPLRLVSSREEVYNLLPFPTLPPPATHPHYPEKDDEGVAAVKEQVCKSFSLSVTQHASWVHQDPKVLQSVLSIETPF